MNYPKCYETCRLLNHMILSNDCILYCVMNVILFGARILLLLGNKIRKNDILNTMSPFKQCLVLSWPYIQIPILTCKHLEVF